MRGVTAHPKAMASNLQYAAWQWCSSGNLTKVQKTLPPRTSSIMSEERMLSLKSLLSWVCQLMSTQARCCARKGTGCTISFNGTEGCDLLLPW